LAALKSLNLAFLVTTEHHCLLGRIEVKADDIPELDLEFRIARELKSPAQMRPEIIAGPEFLHRRLADPYLLGHGPATPAL